jgi:predicted lipoprotein
MYNQFLELAERQGLNNYVRCVYSIGEIEDVNVDSTHHIMPVQGKYDDVMVRVGHFLDESDEPGIFKI